MPSFVPPHPRPFFLIKCTYLSARSLTSCSLSRKEVTNEGWRMREVPNEAIMIRGFTIEKDGEERITA